MRKSSETRTAALARMTYDTSRHGLPWTKEDVAMLREMRCAKKAWREIAEQLRRPRHSVMDKGRALGLTDEGWRITLRGKETLYGRSLGHPILADQNLNVD